MTDVLPDSMAPVHNEEISGLLFITLALLSVAASARPSRSGTSPSSAALTSSALGSAQVFNACPFAVHSNIVHSSRPDDPEGTMPEEIYIVLPSGEQRSHPYSHDPNMGISWKIWRGLDLEGESVEAAATQNETMTGTSGDLEKGPIQFEYSWSPDLERIWWDLSMIDAGTVDATKPVAEDTEAQSIATDGVTHAFGEYDLTLAPVREGVEVEDEGNCYKAVCEKGSAVCKSAYNSWNDWSKQKDCGETVGLKLTLCG